MRAGSVFLALVLFPGAAGVSAQDLPPAGIAAVEGARSRACVPALNRLEALNRELEPYAARLERMRALGRAVSLEDRAEAGTLVAGDSLELAVAEWFAQDSTLAARWVAEGDSTLQDARAAARTAILGRITATMQAVGTEAQGRLGDAAQIESAAAPCEGAVLVRPAVLEACAGETSELCQAAAATEQTGPFRFVDAAEDLWDISDFRPWSQAGPLQVTPQGALVGGRTGAQARRGNLLLAVGIGPLIRNRSELSEEEVATFQANLDSLGFTFDHPAVVMAPAWEITASVSAPMDGETHVIVHFGDLSGDDVIWSTEVGEGGLLQAVVPASGADLARLQAGEVVSLTAVRVPEAPEGETPEADAVYTLAVLQVGQAQQVAALIQYMAGGGMSQDLAALLPPPGGGAPAR